MRCRLLLPLLATCLGAAAAGAQEPVTAFVDVNIVPMDREHVLSGQTVLVHGQRITAMGPTRQVRVPAGAVRVDGRGKFLIPGLADMHSHGAGNGNTDGAQLENALFMYVANGVTTIQAMFVRLEDSTYRVARARAAKGELLSPRIYIGGEPFDANIPGKVVAGVTAMKGLGYDVWAEHLPSGRAEGLDSFQVAAHRAGLPIAVHAPSYADGSLERVVRDRYRAVEHMTGWAEYLTGGRSVDRDFASHPIDERKVRSMGAAMRQAGVFNDPTLLVGPPMSIGSVDLTEAEQWPELRYQSPAAQAEEKTLVPTVRADSGRAERMRRADTVVRHIIRALQDEGAGLLVGTDGPELPYIVPGFGVHRELQALVRAGLTPYEALAAGTRNVAAYFGTQDSTGTIAVGKRADLVLLSGNPLTDIRHTMQPAGVMLNGRWLPRAELDARLAKLEGGWREARPGP